MMCEYCQHYDDEDGIKICMIKMDAINYIDIEDCDYFKDNMKERNK